MLGKLLMCMLCFGVIPATGSELYERNERSLQGSFVYAGPVNYGVWEEEVPGTIENGQVTCIAAASPEPKSVSFDADIAVNPSYQVSEIACTQDMQDEIGRYIEEIWDKFVAENEVLGPLDLERTGSFCGSGDRRLEELLDTEPTFRQQRSLQQRTCLFCYRGSGRCAFCSGDNRDARRRLQANPVPVTLYIQTDYYPEEMGYNIKDTDGNVLVSGSNIYDNYQRTVFLEPGYEYIFEATDAYGDGWCCDYGEGGASIYEGTSTQQGNKRLLFNGQFVGSSTSMYFKVDHPSIEYDSSDESEFDNTVGPQLESDLSEWLTYYLQQRYASDSTSCLYGSYPYVSVELTAVEEASTSKC